MRKEDHKSTESVTIEANVKYGVISSQSLGKQPPHTVQVDSLSSPMQVTDNTSIPTS